MEASPMELDTLYLDNKTKSTTVKGLEDFQNLHTLSLNNIGISSLEGFPNLRELKKLFLADNKIAGGLEHLAKVSSLEFIDLSNNKLTSVDQFKPLADLGTLTYLEVEHNPFSEKDHTDKLFEMLQQVEYINSKNRDGEEIEEIDEEEDDEEDSILQGDEDANGYDDEDDDEEEPLDEEDEEEFNDNAEPDEEDEEVADEDEEDFEQVDGRNAKR